MDLSQLTPQMRAMLNSQEAKELANLLSKKDNSIVQKAVEAAKAGDSTAIKQTLRPLMQDQELMALLKNLMTKGGI